MATTSSTRSSRWGSFLQQAAAGIESKLDTILADDSDAPTSSTPKTVARTSEQPVCRDSLLTQTSDEREKDLARTPSSSKTHDRLQDRLAKALANKNSSRSKENLGLASGEQPGTKSPDEVGQSGWADGKENADADSMMLPISRTATNIFQGKHVGDPIGRSQTEYESSNKYIPKTSLIETTVETMPPPRPSISIEPRSSKDVECEAVAPRELGITREGGSDILTATTPQEYEALIAQMRSDYEISELRRQEENHTYIERIDALHAKLQYLSKEAVESARKAAASAPTGSLDHRVSEKDERIALLMEEGEKLSKAELKHLNTIKKLRFNAATNAKELSDAIRRLENAEKDALTAREEAKVSDTAKRRIEDRIKIQSRIEKELERLKVERCSDHSTIKSLKAELAQALTRAATIEENAQKQSVEAEQKIIAGLQEELSCIKLEKDLGEENLRSEIRTLKEILGQERECAKVTEVELRGEYSMLESRMETLRARAEEVSTGATGDAQVKLLRQIETLQTQYAVASENWQGIEGTLQSRLRDLENERDEIAKREGDLRRKAREASNKFRRSQEELEAVVERSNANEDELTKLKRQLDKLQREILEARTKLYDTERAHEGDRQAWESEMLRRIAEEKLRWREEPMHAHNASQQSRGGSPAASQLRSSTVDYFGAQSRRFSQRPSSTDVSILAIERPLSSRTPGQPPRAHDAVTPPRHDSTSYLSHPNTNGNIPGTPSVQNLDNYDFFDDVGTPASPNRTINDMISVSTIGAGPSVQLVERMSAAIRRLESEKVSTKEELLRLSKERDEARKEVVELMSEVEQKRASIQQLRDREAEMTQINDRYQTTLEMLGEKSELVEELRADVADIKKIYRELVDSTMR